MTTFDYNYSTSQEHLQKDSIVVMQRIGNLEIKHYGVCDLESPAEVKSSKGLIYTTSDTGSTLVCPNIGFTPEVSANDNLEQIATIVHNVFGDQNARVFASFESSLLRIWYNHSESKWYMSTNRKIDAFNSKWAKPESYGAVFTKLLQERNANMTLDEYYSGLNTNFVYLFAVLATIENRIITTKTKDECQFIGAFNTQDNFTFSFDHSGVVFDHPTQVSNISTIEELCKHVNSIDPYKQQGIMIIKAGAAPECVKIVHPTYIRAFNIRNNTLTPLNRFIQLMTKKYSTDDAEVINPTNMLIKELGDVYPESREQFDEFKDVIASVNVFVPKQQNQVLKELFSRYSLSETKGNFDLSLNALFKVVYTLNENSLYHLYSSFVERRSRLGNGNLLSKEEVDALKTRIK